jgi:transcriptional regulator with XRE-family HTH domain
MFLHISREACSMLIVDQAGEPLSIDQIIGTRLRELRRAVGLTQEELAELFEYVPALPDAWGTRQLISLAEHGRRRFTAEDLIGLAAFFGVSILFLFASEEMKGYIKVGEADVSGSALGQFINVQLPTSSRGQPLMLDRVLPESIMRRLAGHKGRPWARHHQHGFEEAYKLARHRIIRARGEARAGRRYSDEEESSSRILSRTWGPTVQAISRVDESIIVPPWGSRLTLEMKPGEVYTARDELEADLVRQAIRRGVARQVRARRAGLGHGRVT